MPTIRSRCAVIRLGLPDAKQASELLGERLGVDAPTAVRLLRMSSGRPGPLIDAEATGDAARAHAQIRRQILDFSATQPHARLGQLGALVADARAILVAGADDDDAADGTESGDSGDDATDVDAEPKKKSPAKRSGKRNWTRNSLSSLTTRVCWPMSTERRSISIRYRCRSRRRSRRALQRKQRNQMTPSKSRRLALALLK